LIAFLPWFSNVLSGLRIRTDISAKAMYSVVFPAPSGEDDGEDDNVSFTHRRACEILIRHAIATQQKECTLALLSDFRRELDQSKPAETRGRPEFEAKDLSGKNWSSADLLRKGHVRAILANRVGRLMCTDIKRRPAALQTLERPGRPRCSHHLAG
jgi:hypothetical protein